MFEPFLALCGSAGVVRSPESRVLGLVKGNYFLVDRLKFNVVMIPQMLAAECHIPSLSFHRASLEICLSERMLPRPYGQREQRTVEGDGNNPFIINV